VVPDASKAGAMILVLLVFRDHVESLNFENDFFGVAELSLDFTTFVLSEFRSDSSRFARKNACIAWDRTT
jgi:hypothetical protein